MFDRVIIMTADSIPEYREKEFLKLVDDSNWEKLSLEIQKILDSNENEVQD